MQATNKKEAKKLQHLCSLAFNAEEQLVCPLWFPQWILRVNQKGKEEKNKLWSHAVASLSSAGGWFRAARMTHSPVSSQPFNRPRTVWQLRKQLGFCDQRSLPNGKAAESCLLPQSLGYSPYSQYALMSEAAFCILGWGVWDVVTFPPDAPRLQPSVTWEILVA